MGGTEITYDGWRPRNETNDFSRGVVSVSYEGQNGVPSSVVVGNEHFEYVADRTVKAFSKVISLRAFSPEGFG